MMSFRPDCLAASAATIGLTRMATSRLACAFAARWAIDSAGPLPGTCAGRGMHAQCWRLDGSMADPRRGMTTRRESTPLINASLSARRCFTVAAAGLLLRWMVDGGCNTK
jgi:hypothetical protein